MSAQHGPFSRAALEPVAIALAVLGLIDVDDVDLAHVSPAAATLLTEVATWRRLAMLNLVALARLAGDEYVVRLAERAARLTFADLVEWPPETIVALVNKLPAIGQRRARRAA